MPEHIKKDDYYECARCERNTWEEPGFDGCPRGCGMDCEAIKKGSISIILEKH